jgi:hypothetical protein
MWVDSTEVYIGGGRRATVVPNVASGLCCRIISRLRMEYEKVGSFGVSSCLKARQNRAGISLCGQSAKCELPLSGDSVSKLSCSPKY